MHLSFWSENIFRLADLIVCPVSDEQELAPGRHVVAKSVVLDYKLIWLEHPAHDRHSREVEALIPHRLSSHPNNGRVFVCCRTDVLRRHEEWIPNASI